MLIAISQIEGVGGIRTKSELVGRIPASRGEGIQRPLKLAENFPPNNWKATSNPVSSLEEPWSRSRSLKFGLNATLRAEGRPNFITPFAPVVRLNALRPAENGNPPAAGNAPYILRAFGTHWN